MATMSVIRTIAGSLPEVWDVVCDMTAFSEFMEDIHRVTILEGSVESGRTITKWIAMNEGVPLFWTEEDCFDSTTYTIVYRMLIGILDKLEGTWQLTVALPLSDGTPQTTVEMVLDYDFGVPELQELIGAAMDVKVARNCRMMLDGIEARVAERRAAV